MWYDIKKRWWFNYECRDGRASSVQVVKTMKHVTKVLRRLKHEKYKGLVICYIVPKTIKVGKKFKKRVYHI